MRFADAKQAATRRSLAAAGAEDDGDEAARYVVLDGSPDAFSRRLLSGMVDGAELEQLLDGLETLTQNTVRLLFRCPTLEKQAGSLYTMLTEAVALGLLMGREQ